MFIISLITVFIAGYLAITLEHPLRIGKTAIALLMAVALWVIFSLGEYDIHHTVLSLSENLARYIPDPVLPSWGNDHR